MVKTTHPVYAVMTSHAIRPKLPLMVCHKGCVRLGVAIDTHLQFQALKAIRMAGAALHDYPGIIYSMPGQAESGRLDVVEGRSIDQSWLPSLSAVTGSTGWIK